MSFDNIFGAGGNYPAQVSMQKQLSMVNMVPTMPSLQQRLDLAVQEAEERLNVIKEARDIFQRNPDLERLLELMQSGHF